MRREKWENKGNEGHEERKSYCLLIFEPAVNQFFHFVILAIQFFILDLPSEPLPLFVWLMNPNHISFITLSHGSEINSLQISVFYYSK